MYLRSTIGTEKERKGNIMGKGGSKKGTGERSVRKEREARDFM